MSGQSWSQQVEPVVRKLTLAVLFKASTRFNTDGSQALAALITRMADALDQAVKDQRAQVAVYRLLGFKLTISRDG
ncbi:hypothetical protein AB7M49_007001 [Bradyrhizobium elkanii]